MLKLVAALLILSVSAFAHSSVIEKQELSEGLARLNKVTSEIAKLEPAMLEMTPSRSCAFESVADDVQMSIDDLQERLTMIKFVLDHENSAPNDKKILAREELKYINTDLVDLEEESLKLTKAVLKSTYY